MGLLAAGCSLALTLGVAEAALRIVPLVDEERHCPDPLVGHRLIAGFDGWRVNPPDGGRRRIRVNRQGLRDDEYPLDKPAGSRRILLLGDSYCEGAHVPFDDAFHVRLERAWRSASGPPVEIINGGVDGYGTDNMLLFYRYIGRNYRPDLVLMTFVTNDLEDNCRELQQRSNDVEQEPYFSLEGDRLELHDHPFERPHDGLRQQLHHVSRTYHLAWRLLFTRQRQQRAERANAGLPYQFPIHLAQDDDVQKQAWRLLAALYRQTRDETVADGAKLAVVIVTCSWQVHERHRQWFEEHYPHMADCQWDWDKPNRRVQAICQELDIPCLDLLPAFQRAAAADPDVDLHFRGGHWTAAGHALAATELQRFLVEQFPDTLAGVNPGDVAVEGAP